VTRSPAVASGVTAIAILPFLRAQSHSGARAGRLVKQLGTMEKTYKAQRRLLDVAARGPQWICSECSSSMTSFLFPTR